MALLFGLGYDELLAEENAESGDGDETEIRRVFGKVSEDLEMWGELPAPTLVDGETTTLRSVILGMHLVVNTPNSGVTFGIAESILGAVEAILATSTETEIRPVRERTTVTIGVSDDVNEELAVGSDPLGAGTLTVTCPPDVVLTDRAVTQRYRDSLRDACIRVVCSLVSMGDIDVWLRRVVQEEKGLTRSLAFGDVLVCNRNVFGRPFGMRLSDLWEMVTSPILFAAKVIGSQSNRLLGKMIARVWRAERRRREGMRFRNGKQ